MPATATRISIEEYLALPEDGPPWLEYIDGEVVEKPVGTATHMEIIARLLELLFQYRRRVGGRTGPDGRSRFDDPINPRAMLPDVSFFRRGARLSHPDGTLHPPTSAVEVRSPGQTMAHQRARASYYRNHSVEEVWLVDADNRLVEVWDAGRDGEIFTTGTLTSTALPGFEADIVELFTDLTPDFA
ncbi:MAG: Uma2 family endonuclease [Dehalococcoidia bacterium]